MTQLARLEIEAVTLERGARRLLAGLSFTAHAGEAIAVTGGNGAGKTSLLRAIAGFIRPLSGAIRFVGDCDVLDVETSRREHCHLIGHQDGLNIDRTAREELVFAVQWTGGDATAAIAGARRLGLERTLELPVRHLSAGQRRRLVLARLIAAPRTLWLLDEPLTPLDSDSRAMFGEIMQRHLATGGMIVAAVHDPLPIVARSVTVGA